MNLGKMKKHCNGMALLVTLLACLLAGNRCSAVEQPATGTANAGLRQQGGFDVSDTTTLVYYMLSLQWPPGACSVSFRCKGDIPNKFTIFGLWPQSSYNYGVAPYAKNPECTTLKPVNTSQIMGKLEKANMVEELTEAWPNLKNSKYAPKNQQFWEQQWEKNGKCTDYGENPVEYFSTAVNLRNHFVQVFQPTSGSSYKVKALLERIKAVAKGIPEVVCRTKQGTKEKIVAEIRLCYKKGNVTPQGIQDCKRTFSGVCKTELDEVKFL